MPYARHPFLAAGAYTAAIQATFAAPAAHPSIRPVNNLRYEETQRVSFFNGRFSVAIGTGQNRAGVDGSVQTAVLDADRLYPAIAVRDSLNTYLALSARQARYKTWTSLLLNGGGAAIVNDDRGRGNADEWMRGWQMVHGCAANQRRFRVDCCKLDWNPRP